MLDYIHSTMYAFSVTEGPGIWCSCTASVVHFHWWSWLQSGQDQASGEKLNWTESHCKCPWPAWGKYHLVCRHKSARTSPSPCHPRSLQYGAHYHISWHIIIIQLHRTDQSSPGLLSSGIMSVSTRLLCFGTGSQTMLTLQFCTCPLTPHFSIPLRNYFQLGVGKYMTANHMPACPSCKQWKRHAETLTWGQSRVGYDMQGIIFFPVAWPGTILLVMWMRWCGQMQIDGKIPNPPPHLYISV